jgi:hypothetical protein
MISEEGFYKLIAEIQSQGYDQETAGHYAVLIGDMPIVDDAGNVVVMENGKVLARLKPLKFFETE